MIWLWLINALFAVCTLEVTIDGPIGVGTFDYLKRAEQSANEYNCESILLKMNTPGGDLESTRKIVSLILNSNQPYLCVIYPSGAHAGSAGAIIMQACHVSGAMKATNIGAATPIQASGQEIPEDLKKKLWNDTISWLEGITKARGRNLDFSKEIITEAKAVSSEEAEKLGAIDISVNTLKEFLKFAEGRKVKMAGDHIAEVKVSGMKDFAPGIRYHVLQTFADPQLSYFMFLGSLGLLYFEFTHPGAIIPGVVGSIGLVISLVSFHKLDVQWGGVALLLLGLVLFVLEAFVPSFGALGIGGIVAFALGGVFMYESGSYYQLPVFDILLSTLLLGSLLFLISYFAFKAHRQKNKMGSASAIGQLVEVIYVNPKDLSKGEIFWNGERWRCRSKLKLELNEEVKIVSQKGFEFQVEKIKQEV